MGNAKSLSLGCTAIKVVTVTAIKVITIMAMVTIAVTVAVTAAVGAWAFSKDTGSRQNLLAEVYEELQMNTPVDYLIRCRDPIQGTIKIMSYNIFNIKYIKLHERMKAISNLIQRHSPDIILFQEVTPGIYEFFQSCKWWGMYECSVRPEKATKQFFCMLLSKLPVKSFFYKHFENTTSGKGLSVAKITTGSNKTLVIATCHLKSPTPGNKYMAERVSQAKEALNILKSSPNVILGGDMNWDDTADGPFPLTGRWCDAWSILRPDENGYTYDTESNGMLNHSRSLQKRLNRFICRLKHFKMISIEIIGTEAIYGVSCKSKRTRLPVLPSDHYGLILTISPK